MKRSLVDLSQTTYARALRRDRASLAVPYTIHGRGYRAKRLSLSAPAGLLAIFIAMALATYIGFIH